MANQHYWATRVDNGNKVIVGEPANPRPDLVGKYIGYFLPEWEKDGRKRRKYKNALFLQFTCNKDQVIVGEPVQFEVKHDRRTVMLGSAFSKERFDEPAFHEETMTLIIDGVEHSRTSLHPA
jgi:hypothetical protein